MLGRRMLTTYVRNAIMFNSTICSFNLIRKKSLLVVSLFIFVLFFYLIIRTLSYGKKDLKFININDYYTNSYISSHLESLHCKDGRPCSYSDEVDFRVFVLTYSRKASLKKLLDTLDTIEMDGDSAALEIWVDRNEYGKVVQDTLELALSFKWSKGSTRVTVQRHHSGIYGQWINSWRPRESTREVALILEDDMSVSRYVYRWLRKVHLKYANRPDFAGASLNGGDQLRALNNDRALQPNATAFMYVCMGTWGFSPYPPFWRKFQDWYHDLLNKGQVPMMKPPQNCYAGWCPSSISSTTSLNPNSLKQSNSNAITLDFSNLHKNILAQNRSKNSDKNVQKDTNKLESQIFHPYVKDARPTEWYKLFEGQGRTDTMWEMWFIYFSTSHKRFTIYSYLNSAFKSKDDLILHIKSSNSSKPHRDIESRARVDLCLGINRKEAGLHFFAATLKTSCYLVEKWLPEFDHLPDELLKYDWNGEEVMEN